MNKAFEKIGNYISKTTFKIKKNSPQILLITGIVGTVASAVLACRATLKVKPVIDEAKDKIKDIHDNENDSEKEDVKKDITIVYSRAALKVAALYLPAVALGTLSIGSICTSNKILKNRNVALAAAYAAVDNSFKAYRKRVIDKFGEEVDKQLKYNIKEEEVEETEEKNGKTKTVKKKKNVVNPDFPNYSMYARIFDETNEKWNKDADTNRWFLNRVQSFFNDRLRTNGYVFLNDVYEELGFPKTKAGQVVGWIYDPDNKYIDSYIDFGIYDVDRQKAKDFVNGYERSIILDFNVDGNIWELWDYKIK